MQVGPSRLAAANARLRGMRVGDFELVEEPLHLGDANGNRFEVSSSILRHCCPFDQHSRGVLDGADF